MAHRDIMPFISPSGQTIDIQHYPMNAAETFVAGEPVRVDADGNVATCVDDATIAGFMGIALAPSPFSIQGTLTNRDPQTGAAYATGASIPIAIARQGCRFISDNFSTGGGGVAVVPTLAVIGDTVGVIVTGGVWFFDVGLTAANMMFRITDVLDANKNSLKDPRFSGNVGVFVVADVTANQLTVVTAPEA